MKPPVDDIVPRSFPKIKPEYGVSDYFVSKHEGKQIKKYPEWDVSRNSVPMHLVLAKRELYLSEKRLHDKRKLLIKKNEQFNKQWKELEEKEKALKRSFQKFNKFVRENQEKRERAERKIVEEVQLQEKRMDDIDSVKDHILQLTEVKALMDQKIKEYRMFEDYLQSVVKSSPKFKNVNDIIIRYEALTEAKEFLGLRQEKELSALENARSDMFKLIEEKTLILVGLNNGLSELQGRYDAAKSDALLWETLVSKIQDMSAQRTAQINLVRVSCYNIYKKMCARKNVEPTLPEEDFEGHLLFIKRTLRELRKILKVAKKKPHVDSGIKQPNSPTVKN